MYSEQIPEASDQQMSQEEEQHFYFTLQAFEGLVFQYGAEKVLRHMDEEIVGELWRKLNI